MAKKGDSVEKKLAEHIANKHGGKVIKEGGKIKVSFLPKDTKKGGKK